MSHKVKLQKAPTGPTSSLSNQVWGIDWNSYFPRRLAKHVRAEIVPYQAASPIIAQIFPEIYAHDEKVSHFHEDDVLLVKKRYYEQAGDFFVFYDEEQHDRVAGMAVGTLLDWSGYNFRNIAIVPDYQQHGLYVAFFEALCEILKGHGVKRIEGDVAPTNRHHIHVLNKMGYIVTSLSLSERWGALLHITKYLNPEDEARFGQAFSSTYASDEKANKRNATVSELKKR